MGRVEYKIERIKWQDDHESRLKELATALNRLTQEGWRVVSVDLAPHPAFTQTGTPVLLERDFPA